MEGVGIILFLVILAGGLLAAWKADESRFDRVVAHFGLRLVDATHGRFHGGKVGTGVIRGQELRIGDVVGHGKKRETQILVCPTGRGVPFDLQLTPESFSTSLEKTLLGIEEIATGDEMFDQIFFIRASDEAGALAILDSGTRTAVQTAFSCDSWTVREGRLQSTWSGFTADEIFAKIDRGISASERLGAPSDIDECLIRNAERNTVMAVRLRNLELVVARRRTQAIEKALIRMASSGIWTVAIPAAKALGSAGIPHLASAVASAPAEEAVRAVIILEGLGGSDAHATLRSALGSGYSVVREEAARVLGRHKDAASREAIAHLLDDPTSAGVRRAAADALGKIGGMESAGVLRAALGDVDMGVRSAAATALAACGTVDDVAYLLDRAEHDPERGVRRAAREAVAAIQSRLGPAERGQLSVADPTAVAGALSVEPGAGRGDLSIDDQRAE